MTAPRVPTADEVLAFPVTVDLPTAGRCFGIGRDAAYELARQDRFPVPVLRLGRRLVVTRAALVDALGLVDTSQSPRMAAFAQAGELAPQFRSGAGAG